MLQDLSRLRPTWLDFYEEWFSNHGYPSNPYGADFQSNYEQRLHNYLTSLLEIQNTHFLMILESDDSLSRLRIVLSLYEDCRDSASNFRSPAFALRLRFAALLKSDFRKRFRRSGL